MSDSEPIVLRPRNGASSQGGTVKATSGQSTQAKPTVAVFDRRELSDILALYGRKVAAGEWRDYAMDFGKETAVFSVYRRSSEWPLYRIEKTPKNARKQGAFSVISATGLIMKRGHELKRVLEVLEKRKLYVVES